MQEGNVSAYRILENIWWVFQKIRMIKLIRICQPYLKIDVRVLQMQEGDVSANRIVEDVWWTEIIVAKYQNRVYKRFFTAV